MDEKNVAPKDAKPQKMPESPERRAAEKIDPADQPFIRAENEDDDGYDPYSDRQPHPEPLFERDPWD
ncbi:hypothetical protein [Tractidigestivibacter scatoligenes]|jgi:hypothetical protein|uniref:hypothetical protein n=1 Tax=Tractidigestivibacter scatoligenes TaxID=1299998 RepID=UPI002F352AF6